MRRLPIILIAIASSGCVSPTFQKSDLPIEITRSVGVKFSALKATRRDAAMIVSGNIRSLRRWRAKGHVDVFFSNDGKTVALASAKIMYFRPLQRTGYFRVRKQIQPDRVDAISLSYDAKALHLITD